MSLHETLPTEKPGDSQQAKACNPTEQDGNKNGRILQLFGARGDAGWRVKLIVLPGAHQLSPAAARELGRELIDYAELLEGKRW